MSKESENQIIAEDLVCQITAIDEKPRPKVVIIWLIFLTCVAMFSAVRWEMLASVNRTFAENAAQMQGLVASQVEQDIPTIVTNWKGVVTRCNAAMLRLLVPNNQYFPHVEGHNIAEWMQPEMAAEHDRMIREAKKERRDVDMEIDCEIIVDGETIPITAWMKSYIARKRIYVGQFRVIEGPE